MITNKNNYDEVIQAWLRPSVYEPNPKRISVTNIDKPLQEIRLAQQHWKEQSYDYGQFVNAKIGQALHKSLEDIDLDDAYQELKLEVPIQDIVLVGKIDLIHNNMIKDYKTTRVYKLRGKYDEKKWIQQLSIYRWMYHKLYDIQLNSTGIVYAFLLDYNKYTKDFTSPIVTIKIKLWDLNKTDRFMSHYLSKYCDKEVQRCTPEDHWFGKRCQYCSAEQWCTQWKEVK